MSNWKYREDSLGKHAEEPESSSALTAVYGDSGMRMTAGACRKCGHPGHLAFQCYNFLKHKGESYVDVSSTSSESDYETPLTAEDNKRKTEKERKKHSHRRLEDKRKTKRKKKKHSHRKHHKRRKSNSSGSEKRKISRKREKRS